MQIRIIQGGTLLDGTGKPPVEDAVVVIEGNVITKVGKRREVKLPQGSNVEIIDAVGKIIMPGLIDSHVHIYTDGEVADEFTSLPIHHNELDLAMRSVARLKRILEMGITSLRDGGSGWGWLEVALRDAINRGDIVGPRFFATGYHLTVTGGHGHFLPPWLAAHKEQCGMHCDGPDEWRKAARLNIYHGTDNIKVVASRDILSPGRVTASQPTLEELTAAIEEAHKMGKRAIAHASGPEAIQKAIKAGADVIVHGFFMDEKTAEMMVQNKVFLESTNLYAKRAVEMGKGKLPDWMVEAAIEAWEDRRKNFRMYIEKGIKISLGSDCGVPFLKQGDNAVELTVFVELGMSPMDAIVSATKIAAEAIGIEGKVGTIEVGKLADIILVDGNPLSDISVLSKKEKIKMVMKDGEIVVTR
jgi:imidazolonepropionase-like amidohydrolase